MKSDFLQLGFSVECTGWTDNMLSMKSKIGVLPSTKYLIKIPDNTQLNRMPIPKAEADPDPNRFITFGYTRSVLDPKLKTPSRHPLQCRACNCIEAMNCAVSKKHMQQTWVSQAKDILHVVSALYLRNCGIRNPSVTWPYRQWTEGSTCSKCDFIPQKVQKIKKPSLTWPMTIQAMNCAVSGKQQMWVSQALDVYCCVLSWCMLFVVK